MSATVTAYGAVTVDTFTGGRRTATTIGPSIGMMIHENHCDLQPTSPGNLIEIFGPAATGKSIVTEALARRVAGYQFAYRVSKPRHMHRFLWRAVTCGPAVTFKLLLGSGGARRCAKERIYLEVLYDVMKNRTPPARGEVDRRGIFFDQGPLHMISDLHPSNNARGDAGVASAWWHAQLARWRDTLDVVVSLHAPVETIIQRSLDRRKDHRLYRWIKDKTPQEATRLIEAHVAIYQEMLDVLADGTARVLSFDTTRQSVEAIVEETIQQCQMPTSDHVPLAGTARRESNSPTGSAIESQRE